jgi:hypothetical protein
MLLMKNELLSATFVALIVSVLVWFHVPRSSTRETDVPKGNSLKLACKSFFIAFVLSYMVFYFLGDTESKDALDHVIKGEPDF